MRGLGSGEDAIRLGAVALMCVIVIFGVSRIVSQLLEGSGAQRQQPQQALSPPNQAPTATTAARTPHTPQTVRDCTNGGWRTYVGFISEDGCIYFVTNTKGG
jgi:hypothetical protein